MSGLADLFEDLEQQAMALALAERDDEVAALSTAAWAEVEWASRLHAAACDRSRVALVLLGGLRLHGSVARVGADMAVVAGDDAQWAVRLAAVAQAVGLGAGSLPEPARPLQSRLGMAALLRGVAEQDYVAEITAVLLDATSVSGRPIRVGRDFVEFDGPAAPVVIALGAVAAVRVR